MIMRLSFALRLGFVLLTLAVLGLVAWQAAAGWPNAAIVTLASLLLGIVLIARLATWAFTKIAAR